MTDKLIDDLPAASALAGADLVPVRQGGVTKKATITQVATAAAGGSYTPPTGTGFPHITTGAQDAAAKTATETTALLDAVAGDSGSGGTKGLVPAPAAGDAAAGKFLKASGAWAAPSLSYAGLPPLGVQISTFGSASGTYLTSSPGIYRNGYMYLITSTRIMKINAKTGQVTALTPSTLSNGVANIIVWSAALAKFVIGGANGFITLDPSNDTFGTIVAAPAGWGQVFIDYDDVSGFLYYCGSAGAARCNITGGSQSNGGTFASAAIDVLVVGANLLVLESATPAKVWKYSIGSWPTLGSSITLDGALATGSKMCALASGLVAVPGSNGIITIIDPATMTTVTTITLTGSSGVKTLNIRYDATVNRIFALDNAGKVWVIDGTSYAVLLAIVPSTSAPTAGLTYDPGLTVLWLTTTGGSTAQRFLT